MINKIEKKFLIQRDKFIKIKRFIQLIINFLYDHVIIVVKKNKTNFIFLKKINQFY